MANLGSHRSINSSSQQEIGSSRQEGIEPDMARRKRTTKTGLDPARRLYIERMQRRRLNYEEDDES